MDRLCGQPKTSAVLHRAQPSQLLFRPLLVVVSQIGVEHAAEFGYRHARPVPMVEEFILEPAEESLHRRLVRAAPLLRHRPGQVVLFEDRYPARSTVTAPVIGMCSYSSVKRDLSFRWAFLAMLTQARQDLRSPPAVRLRTEPCPS